jgi:hypothetical protein
MTECHRVIHNEGVTVRFTDLAMRHDPEVDHHGSISDCFLVTAQSLPEFPEGMQFLVNDDSFFIVGVREPRTVGV